jgi:hypothetical protein
MEMVTMRQPFFDDVLDDPDDFDDKYDREHDRDLDGVDEEENDE